MDIIHTTPRIGPYSFGLGPVAINLVNEQSHLGINAAIWCVDNDNSLKWVSETSGLPLSCMRNFRKNGPGGLSLSFDMERAARLNFEGDLVLHQHGIWSGLSRVATIFHEKNAATVIAPHGSLEEWALKRHKWKKRLVLAICERNNLRNASCLHACSELEIAGFRDFGLTNPIAIIPNGISSSWLESSGNAEDFRTKYNIPTNKRIFLYLSRITPVKGLPVLMESLNLVRQNLADWLLVIAGADEFDHKAEVLETIKKLNLKDHIRFVGMLVDKTKRDAFAASELFVLPTKREAAPVVVLEALGAGVPVLTTKGAPWGSLPKYGCGWWTDVDSSAIAEALKDAVSYSPAHLKQMGQRGKDLVAAEYTWTKSAQMTIELYEWLLGRKERPGFVIID